MNRWRIQAIKCVACQVVDQFGQSSIHEHIIQAIVVILGSELKLGFESKLVDDLLKVWVLVQ